MMMTNSDVIATLNGLIETCKDGQEGFQAAANGVTDTTIRQLFLDYSLQRAQFASELQALVQQIGGNPETTGSVSAALHRGWINLKAAITGKDEHAILEECQRGEDAAVNNYRDALGKVLSPSVAAVVQVQYDRLVEARDQVRGLKIVTASAASS